MCADSVYCNRFSVFQVRRCVSILCICVDFTLSGGAHRCVQILCIVTNSPYSKFDDVCQFCVFV